MNLRLFAEILKLLVKVRQLEEEGKMAEGNEKAETISALTEALKEVNASPPSSADFMIDSTRLEIYKALARCARALGLDAVKEYPSKVLAADAAAFPQKREEAVEQEREEATVATVSPSS